MRQSHCCFSNDCIKSCDCCVLIFLYLQEITLWRKGERLRRPLQQQLMAQQTISQKNQQSSFPQSHPQGQPPEFVSLLF